MKKAIIVALKSIVLLITLAVFAFMIRFPMTEGRAANLDLISIYKDPFIIYGYIASIPFYIGAYNVFKLLGYIEKKKTFSKTSLSALRNVKYCALALIGGIVLGETFLVMFGPQEDIAGIIAVGIYTSVMLGSIALIAEIFNKRIKFKLAR